MLIGYVITAVVVLEIGTTTYRSSRYYSGREAYVRNGPPHPILRVLGPIVTALTIAVLATGIGLIVQGHSAVDPEREPA